MDKKVIVNLKTKQQDNIKKNVELICTPLRFYNDNDEDFLFAWIHKVKSIKDATGYGRELHLTIEDKNIPNDDLLDLMGIFDRYKFDTKQLEAFKNEANKKWFDEE